MAHSKEPWKVTMDMILDASDNLVLAQKGPSGLNKEDMQRIVACVNFCKNLGEDLLKTESDTELWAKEFLIARGWSVAKITNVSGMYFYNVKP